MHRVKELEGSSYVRSSVSRIPVGATACYCLGYRWVLLPATAWVTGKCYCPLLPGLSVGATARYCLGYRWVLLPATAWVTGGCYCPLLPGLPVGATARYCLLLPGIKRCMGCFSLLLPGFTTTLPPTLYHT